MNVMRYLMVPIVALLLAACGDDASRSERMVGQAKPDASGTAGVGPDASRAGTIKISFVMKSLANPFFVEMARGARQAQREQGIVLQVQASSPETSVEQQIRMVESQIGAGVKAIVISPVDTRRLVPVLKRAQDAGIRIVNVDERIQPEALAQHGMKQVPFIGVDSQLGAYQAAKFLADKLVKPTEAAVIEGIPGTNTSIDRRKGIEKAFAENSKIRIVARGAANWKAEEAYELARRMFKAHPRIGAVYCANDTMAIGVIRHLQELGRKDVLIGGFDAITEATDAIRAGQMTTSVDQRADEQGYIGVMTALKLLRGEPVPDVVLVDTTVATPATLIK